MIEKLINKAKKLEIEISHLDRVIDEEKVNIEKCREKLVNTKKAQEVINIVSQAVQEQAHKQISHVVSECLNSIFEEDAYEFRIVFERKRNKTEARLAFVKDGEELDPSSSVEGGALDVASFALRLSALMLSVPRRRRLLVLDEPFKMLDKYKRPKVRELLEKLSQEMEVQIIMITHDPELQIGKVIEIE